MCRERRRSWCWWSESHWCSWRTGESSSWALFWSNRLIKTKWLPHSLHLLIHSWRNGLFDRETRREGLKVELNKNRIKGNSEAGNRTPVVRVTGGNTKPLYYFGSVFVFKLPYFNKVNSGSFAKSQDYSKNHELLSDQWKHFDRRYRTPNRERGGCRLWKCKL